MVCKAEEGVMCPTQLASSQLVEGGCLHLPRCRVPGEQPLELLTDHAARVHHRGAPSQECSALAQPLFSFHTRILS